ncbi:MAG: hypothetical protein ACK4GN_13240 [Runella sp.]
MIVRDLWFLGQPESINRKLSGLCKMKPVEADWTIETVKNLISSHSFRQQFLICIGDDPEAYGYVLPPDEPLPFDPPRRLPADHDESLYVRWKNGNLAKKRTTTQPATAV